MTKITFLVRFLCQLAMYGFLLHLFLKLFGQTRKDLKASLVTYGYIVIVGLPLSVILEYPLLLSFGPAAIFGTPEDLARLADFYEDNPSLRNYILTIVFFLAGLGTVLVCDWFHKIHSVGRLRVFVSLLLAGGLGGVIQLFVLNPVFLAVFEWIDGFLKYA
jgi:hypothetical protein